MDGHGYWGNFLPKQANALLGKVFKRFPKKTVPAIGPGWFRIIRREIPPEALVLLPPRRRRWRGRLSGRGLRLQRRRRLVRLRLRFHHHPAAAGRSGGTIARDALRGTPPAGQQQEARHGKN